jgi:hypothetical protein
MKKILNLRAMIKVFGLSLFVFGLFSVSYGQPPQKFYAKFDKTKKLFRTPAVNFPGGKLVVSGVVKGVDVSGGSDGCYTLTVSTYRIAPNGEKILVQTRSKQVCVDITKLPELVVDRLPLGKYIVEVGIDRPRGFDKERFEAEINVINPSER